MKERVGERGLKVRMRFVNLDNIVSSMCKVDLHEQENGGKSIGTC